MGGSGLDSVVQCLFFMRTNDDLFKLFDGFRVTFNEAGLLPPTRCEYVAGADTCEGCNTTAKCFGVTRQGQA